MYMKDLNYYVECFSSLHTMKKCGKPAPHKALLQCEDIEIYKYYVKALNRMVEAWKPFFEPYKK